MKNNISTSYDPFRQAFHSLNKIFTENGHEIRAVGGAVRDSLLNKIPKDVDFCTTATPAEMKQFNQDAWDIIPTGEDHGTLTFISLLGCFEITTLRKDVDTDGRHATVEFTNDWKEDAARRDFTINAMSFDIDGNIYDYFNGREDLQNRVVKFVGNADDRIKEDALRIMRYFRMLFKFDSAPVLNEDFKSVVANAELLQTISVERIWDEIKKVCKDSPDKISNFLELLRKSGVADILRLNLDLCYSSSYGKNIASLLPVEAITRYPELVIAIQASSKHDVESFAERYKISNAELNNMLTFVEYSNPKYNTVSIQEIIQDTENKIDRNILKAIAEARRNKWLSDTIEDIHYVPFPITGDDLLNSGYVQGKELGLELKRLKEIWKQSNYTKTKEELLNVARR